MSYVYTQPNSTTWLVGFYTPDGDFIVESEHESPEAAARRVNYLNGGAPDIHMTVQELHGNTTTFQKPRFSSEAMP